MTTPTYSKKRSAIHRLRVNLKSLTAEARIIRTEAAKTSPLYAQELTAHRRGELREAARITHLALAYLRKTPYRVAEKNARKLPDPKQIFRKVDRFMGPGLDLGGVSDWLNAA